MLTGIGYKNERLLIFSLDLLLVSTAAVITYFLFGFPHFFSYFQELAEASEIINPAAYIRAAGEIHERFEQALLEVGILYWLYESLALCLFGQTLGKKVFHRKLVFAYEGPGRAPARIFVFLTRTAVKVICVCMMVPVLVIGIQFLLSRKDRTLLDRIFLTRVEEVEG